MSDRNTHHKTRWGSSATIWFPTAFFLICILTIGAILLSAEKREVQTLQIETDVAAEQIKMRLEAWIGNRITMVSLLSKRSDLDPVRSPQKFAALAQSITEAFPGFQALNFIDPDFVIRIINPVAGNQNVLGKDLHLHPAPEVPAALKRAQAQKTLTRTPILDLLQGRPGFTTYGPIINSEGKILGYVNGVFSVEQLVNGCLHEKGLKERFVVGLYAENGRQAYLSEGDSDMEWPKTYTRQYPVKVLHDNWLLRLAPSPQRLQHTTFGPNKMLAIGGFLLVAMLTILLRAYLLRINELQRSREGYRLLVDNIVDMVVTVGPQCTMDFCSPSFAGFLGQPDSSVRGQELSSYAHSDDQALVVEAHKKILAGEPKVNFEVRFQTPHGYRWTQWSSSPLMNAHAELNGAVSVGRDIHDRRHLEEQLRRSQKLQAVGQLAGGIAHDFNNIIQAIQGYLEFALEDLPTDSPTRADLAQAHKASERATVLTSKILAFSSRQSVQAIALDLNQTTMNMRSMLVSLLGQNMELVVHQSRTPAIIKSDPGQIEQILMNLCINAREAMSQTGCITISIQDVQFREKDLDSSPWAMVGAWIRLAVQDHGVGIPPDIQDLVFEPFFTTRETGKGTGLGLATVYGITKQQGGFIHLISAPGQGTTVEIFFPPTEEKILQARTKISEEPQGAGETILLVEDEDLVRDMTARILNQSGYQVLVATTGEEALNLVQLYAEDIDAALLDLVLPGMTGREIHAAITHHLPAIPTLFMSGFDPLGSSDHDNRELPGPLLAKPFSRPQLLTALRNIF